MEVLYLDTQYNNRWSNMWELPISFGHGNIGYVTGSPAINDIIEEWLRHNKHYAPKCLESITEDSFIDVLKEIHKTAEAKWTMHQAFMLEPDLQFKFLAMVRL